MNEMAEDLTRRLVLSRQTLYGWQQPGGPVGRPEDLLRMIGQEIEVLEGIARENAEFADSVNLLIERYQALQSQVRQKAN